jgi:hypothetical protein
MIIAMSIPMLLKILMDSSGWMQIKFALLLRYFHGNASSFERHIVYEERRTSWGSVMTGRDQKNNVLQKAITLYIDEHCAAQMAGAHSAKIDLMAIKFGDDNRRGDDDDDDDDDAAANRKTGLGELKKYKVTSSVPPNIDFRIEPGLFLRITSSDESDKDPKANASVSAGMKKTVVFSVRCTQAPPPSSASTASSTSATRGTRTSSRARWTRAATCTCS